jgi:hypothetical protein
MPCIKVISEIYPKTPDNTFRSDKIGTLLLLLLIIKRRNVINMQWITFFVGLHVISKELRRSIDVMELLAMLIIICPKFQLKMDL